jgi:alpha-mannosidase
MAKDQKVKDWDIRIFCEKHKTIGKSKIKSFKKKQKSPNKKREFHIIESESEG